MMKRGYGSSLKSEMQDFIVTMKEIAVGGENRFNAEMPIELQEMFATAKQSIANQPDTGRLMEHGPPMHHSEPLAIPVMTGNDHDTAVVE